MIVDLSRNDLGRVARLRQRRAGRDPRRAAPGPVAPRHRRARARARGHDRRRPRPRGVPARLGDRRAEDPGAEGDRRARGLPARGLHGRDRVREPARRAASSTSPSARSRRPAGARGWAAAAGSWPTRTRRRSCARRSARPRRSPRALGARVPEPPPAAPPAAAPAALAAPPRPRARACSRRSPCAAASRSTPGAISRGCAASARALYGHRAAGVELPATRPTGGCACCSSPDGAVTVEAVAGAGRGRPRSRSSRARWPAASARTSGSTARRSPPGSSSTSTAPCSRPPGPTSGSRTPAGRSSRRPPTAASCPGSPARGCSRRRTSRRARPPIALAELERARGDRADLLDPARHPRRAAPARRRAAARELAARLREDPAISMKTRLVHSLIRTHARCWA